MKKNKELKVTKKNKDYKYDFSNKYWYKTTIYACVLCGAETRYRERVYREELKGIEWIEEACDKHFM